MSNIDKQALLHAAVKIGAEKWVHIGGGEVLTEEYEVDGLPIADLICECEVVGTSSPKAEFIALANPATVLVLLAELEAAVKRIAELEVLAFSPAILDVISERQRQRSVEGWTSERDDSYQNSELADAAACYAIHAHNQGFSTPAHWPWDPAWWKQKNPRRDLVKAGALILAEIERIDRAPGIKGE